MSRRLAVALLVLAPCTFAADDPFRVTVNTTSGAPLTVTQSSGSLIDLANRMLAWREQFVSGQPAFDAGFPIGSGHKAGETNRLAHSGRARK